MLLLFFIILAISCFVAFTSHKYALTAVLLIGFIQDPFRKVVAGEPIIFIVTVGIVFGVLMLKTVNRVGFSRLSDPFVNWVDYVYKPLALFLVLLTIQFFHSFIRWGNIVVSLIGMLSYLAPFLAIVVGYYSVNSLDDVRKFMKIYVGFGLLVSVTVALSFSGFELSIFREIGVGLKIYDQGTVLRSFSGIMRTGEIASWHLATTACFLMILYATSESKPPIALFIIAVFFLLLVISFTGRRKMVMLVSLFGVCYLFGFFYLRKTLSVTSVIMGFSATFLLWFAVEFMFPSGYGTDVQNYLSRGSSVYSGASSRFLELGLNPIKWAYNRVGLFGGGLGIASQGAQLFQVTSIAGGSGEGGLGKVMVELGLPGLVVIIWLAVAVARYIFGCLKLASQRFVQPQLMILILGAAVFLMVNLMTFSVATQVYGDIFVLLMLGLVSGFVFALPKFVAQNIHQA